jgi:hypothetical protein
MTIGKAKEENDKDSDKKNNWNKYFEERIEYDMIYL